MYKDFTNEDRSRYYGLRIGDQVELRCFGKVCWKGEVVEYGMMDNNAVYVKNDKGRVEKCVAEWCKIISKVDDIKNKLCIKLKK